MDIATLFANLQTLREEYATLGKRVTRQYNKVQKAVAERHLARLNSLAGSDEYLATLLMVNDAETGVEFNESLHRRRFDEFSAMGPFYVSGYHQDTGMASINVTLSDHLKDDTMWAALPDQLAPLIKAYLSNTDSIRIDFLRPDLASAGITYLECSRDAPYRHIVRRYSVDNCETSSDDIAVVLKSIRDSFQFIR